MKKTFKLIISLFIIFLLTGCTGDYNVTINEDLSVKEELNLELDNQTGNEYSKAVKIFQDNNISDVKYHVSVNGSKVVIKYENEFNSIDEYVLESKVYHQLVDEIKYSKMDDYIDIYITEKLKLNDNDTIQIGNVSDIDFLQINIKNPFKMITNNSDISNEDVYTWNINKDNINKKILMQFEPKSNKFPHSQVIMAIVLFICFSVLIGIVVKNYRDKNKI